MQNFIQSILILKFINVFKWKLLIAFDFLI